MITQSHRDVTPAARKSCLRKTLLRQQQPLMRRICKLFTVANVQGLRLYIPRHDLLFPGSLSSSPYLFFDCKNHYFINPFLLPLTIVFRCLINIIFPSNHLKTTSNDFEVLVVLTPQSYKLHTILFFPITYILVYLFNLSRIIF